jgi:hypothetical protein
MPPAENLAKSTPRDQFTAGGRFRILNNRVRAFFQAASPCATAVGTSMALAAGRAPFRAPVGSARATERPTRSAIGQWSDTQQQPAPSAAGTITPPRSTGGRCLRGTSVTGSALLHQALAGPPQSDSLRGSADSPLNKAAEPFACHNL